AELLRRSSELHRHLCPRQVLGVRMGVWAGELLGLELPQKGKRLLVVVETDGCFADGVSVATGCWLGRRTMRLLDYGRVAATFVDTQSLRGMRLAPRPGLREQVQQGRRLGQRRWDAYMEAYQELSADELFRLEWERSLDWVGELVGKPSQRAVCAGCGEEVLNGREVRGEGLVLCRACAGVPPYQPAGRPPGVQ
ncbi:FmdE family protein, partial [Meiothermus granaticius]